MSRRLRNQLGMTLLEIIIAVGIIGSIGGYIFKKVIDNAKHADVKTTQVQINDLVSAVKMYKRDKKNYPPTDQGLQALVDAGQIDEVPTDPWGGDYNYESPGSHGEKFEIWSNGPDEESDTDDDVVSWKSDK